MGKALVYARQGRDLEAQRITTQAVNFGYDPVLANKVIYEMIERRENSENIPKERSVPSGLNN